ncbi:MAG: hypothetical protein K0S58_2599 [Nitrospira sp.]|jgi:hypothetical protein|nr:hypothetical protein [Nitrospira sp.]
MHTLLCHELLAQQECEGLTDIERARTITLPDHTIGRHLECEAGHKFHLSLDGDKWPCDCYSPDSGCC